MKKQMVRNLIFVCVIGLVFITAVIFIIQTNSAYRTSDEISPERLNAVVSEIEENNISISELRTALDKEYIEKARSFAEMIRLKPDIIKDMNTLLNIQKMLGVDELHVTDDKGVLWWGTIEGYYGFDFSTSEQTKPFLPILNDSSIEIAQDPTLNGAEAKLFQYISVARTDSKGIVQIGMSPTRLDNAMANNSIDKVLNSIVVGNTGYVFAINKADNTFASHPNASLIGTEFTGKLSSSKPSFIDLDNKSVYCTSMEYSDYILVAAIPETEMFSDRKTVTLTVFIFALIMFAIITVAVNALVQKNIISGIYSIINTLKDVTNGNFNRTVEVRNNAEFNTLSDGINSMVFSIKEKMTETENYLESQNQLVVEIGNISGSVNEYSAKMSDVADAIASGSVLQEDAVSELQANFDEIAKQVQHNTEISTNAQNITKNTEMSLLEGNKQIGQMQVSMDRIKHTSSEIGKIVKTIEDISFQTNILALNAAVEAARAGAAGKGFAVVADEVRNLANRSSEAVKGTEELISAAVTAVEEGSKIASETAQTISGIVTDARQSTEIINEITIATQNQAAAIVEVSHGFENIMNVVKSNSEIANQSQDTAHKIAQKAESLMNLIGK